MMNSEFGYPIPSVDRDDILHEVVPALEEFDIYSRGRFGGWKYDGSGSGLRCERECTGSSEEPSGGFASIRHTAEGMLPRA